jgi:hypothetical protein
VIKRNARNKENTKRKNMTGWTGLQTGLTGLNKHFVNPFNILLILSKEI